MNISIRILDAPSTPLNLQTGVTYAPRVPTPPFVAYACMEMSPGIFGIYGYAADDFGVVLFQGSLLETFVRFAQHLRMDVPHADR